MKAKVKQLVESLYKAHVDFEKVAYDEKYAGKLGKPATSDLIEKFEKKIGFSLPKDYKEFLIHSNGWTEFDGSAKLLSIKDQESSWLKNKISELKEDWESEDPEPFSKGAIPIMMGEDEENYVLLVPTEKNSAGEPIFISYDCMYIEEKYDSFSDYLKDELTMMNEMVEDASKEEPDF